jgi:hypothetical protein
MPRMKGGHMEYLPLGTVKRCENQNRRTKPDLMTMTGRGLAWCAVILSAFCLARVIAEEVFGWTL